MKVRLASGVIMASNNPDVIEQWKKYGLREVVEATPAKKTEAKPVRRRKPATKGK